MKNIRLIAVLLVGFTVFAQENSEENSQSFGTKISEGVSIGGYAQIDYNEPDGAAPGKLDVHRMVMFLGYKFNEKVSFMSEIEYEHVSELYVEQAYLKYKF